MTYKKDGITSLRFVEGLKDKLEKIFFNGKVKNFFLLKD